VNGVVRDLVDDLFYITEEDDRTTRRRRRRVLGLRER
jgi:hypothetical protein